MLSTCVHVPSGLPQMGPGPPRAYRDPRELSAQLAARERSGAATCHEDAGAGASFPRWVRELPAESLRPRLRDTWRLRTPPEQLAEPRAHGGPDRHVEVPDPPAGVRVRGHRC